MELNNLFSQTYEHRSKDVSSRKLLNCFVEGTNGEGLKNSILVGSPGQQIFADYSIEITDGGCRGMYFTSTQRAFAMMGGQFVEIFVDGSKVIHYNAVYYPTEVTFVDDGNKLVFVDGYNYYVFDMNTNTLTIPSPSSLNFANPIKIVQNGNRAIVINNDSTQSDPKNLNQITRAWNRFYYSNLWDFTTFEALSFYTAESSVDAITGIEVRDNDMWIMGDRSYEIWRTNPTDPDDPFNKVGGASSNIGTSSPYTVKAVNDTILFLGSSSTGLNHVYASNGTSVMDITTSAISSFLSTDTAKAKDAFAWTYVWESHTFYVLTFNQLDRTFVFDLSTNKWHERSTRDELLNVHHAWRGKYGIFAFDKILVGDSDHACLYTLSADKLDDDIQGGKTIPLVRILQSPNIVDTEEYKTLLFSKLTLIMETGTSLVNGQGSDAKIMLEISRDGGYSWGPIKYTSIGQIGQNKKIVQFRRNGRGRELTIRLSISDPVRFCLITAVAQLDKGAI